MQSPRARAGPESDGQTDGHDSVKAQVIALPTTFMWRLLRPAGRGPAAELGRYLGFA